METHWKSTAIGLVSAVLILGILAALMLPAIQPAREAGSRGDPASEKSALAPLDTHLDAAAGFAYVLNDTDYGSEPAKEAAGGETTGGAPTDGATASSAVSHRKIIYTATIELAVEDFSDMSQRVAELVKQFDGYVAGSTLCGTSGGNRSGTWKLRVPIEHFDAFVAEAKRLGELVSAATNSQEVTAEYYDVEARIRNKTREEERLLKLLEDRPGKLADVIAIERELSRAREELERMQGRMRVLADQTALTSVDLSAREIRKYVPAETPGFATRVRRAFAGSVAAFQSTAEALAISLVALTPWLAALAVAGLAAYVFRRTIMRRPTLPTSSGG